MAGGAQVNFKMCILNKISCKDMEIKKKPAELEE